MPPEISALIEGPLPARIYTKPRPFCPATAIPVTGRSPARPAGPEPQFRDRRTGAGCHAYARVGMSSSRRTERAQSCHCEEAADEAISTPRIGFVFPGGQPRRIARNSLSPHRLLPIRPAGNWLCSAHFALRPGEIGFVWRTWPHARPRPAPFDPQSAIEGLALFRTTAHPESTAWRLATAPAAAPGAMPARAQACLRPVGRNVRSHVIARSPATKQSQRRELALFSRAGNPAVSLVTHCHHTVCCQSAPPAIGFVLRILPSGRAKLGSFGAFGRTPAPDLHPPIRNPQSRNWLCSARLPIRSLPLGGHQRHQ
jgi:hypothetical protein